MPENADAPDARARDDAYVESTRTVSSEGLFRTEVLQARHHHGMGEVLLHRPRGQWIGARCYQEFAALAQLEVAEQALDQVKRQVELDVWKAYHTMVNEAQKQRHGKSLVDSAVESNRVAEMRYKAGAGTLLDLLNARSAVSTARKQLVQSAAAWRAVRFKLLLLTAQALQWEPDDEDWSVGTKS